MARAPVIAEASGPVLVITIDRPEVRNAFDQATAEAIAAALDRLDADGALRAGILTGAGAGFCSGRDLKALARGEGPPTGGDRGYAGIMRRGPRKPLIAAVEGFAVAGGLEVALSCDIIVAGRSARFGLPEVSRALVAVVGLHRLPRRVGVGAAMQLALTGEPVSGAEAQAIGLVDTLVDDGRALERALEIATAIAAHDPHAVAMTKDVLRRALDWTDDELWRHEGEILAEMLASGAPVRRAQAFLDRGRGDVT